MTHRDVLKHTRYYATLKDSVGKSANVYVYTPKDQKAIASYESNSWNSVRVGWNDKDILYKGNYQLAQKASSSSNVSFTSYKYPNYIYNSTRKMMYVLRTKSKGQPDIFSVAQTESSNFEYADLYYFKNGKLTAVSGAWEYTLRPRIVGKNMFQTAEYDNSDATWTFVTYVFNPSTGKMKITKEAHYNQKETQRIIKGWK